MSSLLSVRYLGSSNESGGSTTWSLQRDVGGVPLPGLAAERLQGRGAGAQPVLRERLDEGRDVDASHQDAGTIPRRHPRGVSTVSGLPFQL